MIGSVEMTVFYCGGVPKSGLCHEACFVIVVGS